jgi:hypothetical protein
MSFRIHDETGSTRPREIKKDALTILNELKNNIKFDANGKIIQSSLSTQQLQQFSQTPAQSQAPSYSSPSASFSMKVSVNEDLM